MPQRVLPLVTDEIYHVFNRGIDKRPTFIDKREQQRALLTIKFYRFVSPPLKLSRLLAMSNEKSTNLLQKLEQGEKLIDIIAFCFMPNHFHFLLRQKGDLGISRFLSQFQNSYTRYFNTKHERVGPLFLDQFKAVRIESDEQLLHVSRYIHLNPYSSFVVKTLNDIISYPWSSASEYILGVGGICDKELVLSFFEKNHSYKDFMYDQADYQRTLDQIKHLAID